MTNNNVRNFILSSLGLACLGMVSVSNAADLSMGDKSFLKNAMQSGLYEIEGSNTAQQKTKNEEVLSFAKQMIEDHTAHGSELKALAANKAVELPTEPSVMHKGKLKILNSHEGAKFDDSYASLVGVAGHEATIKLYEKEAKDGEDPDVKALASKTLPKLQHHLEMGKALKSKTEASAK